MDGLYKDIKDVSMFKGRSWQWEEAGNGNGRLCVMMMIVGMLIIFMNAVEMCLLLSLSLAHCILS